MVWGWGMKRAVSVQNGHMGLREWGTEGRRAAAQQGGHGLASPTELSTPGQGFRAKGQAWDDIGAKGPGS